MPLALLAALPLAIWLYLFFFRGQFWRMRDIGAQPSITPPSARVAAVIPARNEAPIVSQAIASLAAQQYPGEFSIVLVDDHSSDGTAAQARAAAPADRLAVVSAAPLPPGWTGKLWAVSEGIRVAEARQPDYFLLTDADIVHAPDNLRGLVERAERDGYDLVSYMVKLACGTPAERLLIPAFVFFFFLLYPPAWIRDPRRFTAGAAGGCLLIRRTMLERIGGIAAIRDALIDDCALAAAVKRAGGRVWLGLTADTRSIREYATFRQIGRMISRSAFTQLRCSLWLLAATIAGLAVTYLAPPVLTVAGRWPGAAMGLAAWLLMSLSYLPVLRFYRRPWFEAPLLPLVALFYLAATIHSAIAWWRGKGGEWKGRSQAVRRGPGG
jgi:hopene-associated glycosyltransferase HpnB